MYVLSILSREGEGEVMEEQPKKWRPQGGFWLAVLVIAAFVGVDVLGTQFIQNTTARLLIDSLVRVVFGALSLWLLIKYFDKGSWRSVIHGKNLGAALLAGGGVLIYILAEIIIVFTKTPASYWRELKSIPWQLLFADLICQQITTGFFEEITFRGLLLEGYYQHGERTGRRRLVYGLLSGLLFAALHIGSGSELFAGVFGFAMAAIYLHSHNILVPMVLHFLQDLAAHAMGYETQLVMIEMWPVWALLALLVVWAAAFLLLPVKSLPLRGEGGPPAVDEV